MYTISVFLLLGAVSLWWQGIRPVHVKEVSAPAADRGTARNPGGDQNPSSRSSNPGGSSEEQGPPACDSEGKEQGEARAKTIYVHVAGAVRNPGVYRLTEGQRVYEAINLAGPREDADLDSLNLARILADEEHIYVPKKGEPGSGGQNGLSHGGYPYVPGGGTGSGGGISRPGPVFPININAATSTELEFLPGIGPVLAEAIVKYRKEAGPFRTKEDLKKVSGIGDKTFEKIKDLIVIE